MNWDISKSFEFDYGHRVWSQKLNSEYSLDNKLACRHLHGHRGKVIVHLTSKKLENGMVTDFKHLNFFKKFLDDNVDHKFIFDINDPMIPIIFNNISVMGDEFNPIISKRFLKYIEEGNFYIPQKTAAYKEGVFEELYGGVVFVDFVPTAENLSKWLYDYISKKMKDLSKASKSKFKVEAVEFFETPKSHTIYRG